MQNAPNVGHSLRIRERCGRAATAEPIGWDAPFPQASACRPTSAPRREAHGSSRVPETCIQRRTAARTGATFRWAGLQHGWMGPIAVPRRAVSLAIIPLPAVEGKPFSDTTHGGEHWKAAGPSSRRRAQARVTVLAPPVPVDPLIAEAKRRARRRQLIALAMGVVVLGAVAAYAIAHGGRLSAVTPRVSIPAGATGVGCGVRGVGVGIFSPDGRRLYREPGNYSHPSRGFPAIQCSGSTIWAVWFNGAGMMQEASFGARSLDGGQTWRASFSEPSFGRKAPNGLDSLSRRVGSSRSA